MLQVFSSGCFKSRSDVVHIAMASMAGGQRPVTGLRLLPRVLRLTFSSPLLSSPFSSLPFPPSRLGVGVGVRAEVIEGVVFGRRCWREMECGARGREMRCECRCRSSVRAAASAGAAPGRILRPDVRALPFRMKI
jgi:hypothetical protein